MNAREITLTTSASSLNFGDAGLPVERVGSSGPRNRTERQWTGSTGQSYDYRVVTTWEKLETASAGMSFSASDAEGNTASRRGTIWTFRPAIHDGDVLYRRGADGAEFRHPHSVVYHVPLGGILEMRYFHGVADFTAPEGSQVWDIKELPAELRSLLAAP